ncbi:hypothetical protein [Microseira wollei]|uniref:Uncharacterized protein n=1 Tax=Microseira wollei NIES-4236 TaxID=2530354 RepID=A0AAV3XEW6_9CYAN|nr:hypothetical protein [Microseira wollei]GET39976.1 hypothetical protein MiSe_47490 [Microseira wollei NIES-4236]
MNDNNLDRENSSIIRDLNANNSSAVDRAVEYASQIIPRRSGSLSYGNMSLPASVKRAIAIGDANSVQVELDFLRSALTLVRKTQLQDLADYCENYRQRSKEDRDTKALESKMSRAKAAQEQIDRTFEDLIETIVRKKLEAAATISNDKIRELRIKQLERDFETFSNLQKHLVEKLMNIVS